MRYCTHIVSRRSKKLDRCFTTDARAVKFCKASANRGKCCEVYRRKGR